MGNRAAGLEGRASLVPSARRFTLYLSRDVEHMIQRHADCGAPLAIDAAKFAFITDLPDQDVKSAFAVFDDQARGLIDAVEAMATIALVASVDQSEKVATIYKLFDFGKRGSLTLDEVVILLHAVATGARKVDPAISCPELEVLEALVKRTFMRVGKTVDEEIAPEELDLFCQLNSAVANFLRYITGAAQLGRVAPGQRWRDVDFDDVETVLYGAHPAQELADFGARPFGNAANFVWRDPPRDYVVIVPDDVAVSRLCPGFGPSTAVCDALNIIAVRPKLLHALFVITGQEAAGRFTLRLFHKGEWAIISVDERMLCSRAGFCASCGSHERPFAGFSHATDHAGEVWMHIVEKALAKLVGSFASLTRLSVLDVLECLTGGVSSLSPVSSSPIEAYKLLHRGFLQGVLGLVRRMPSEACERTDLEARLAQESRRKAKGIVPGKIYAVSCVRPEIVSLFAPACTRKHAYEAKPGQKNEENKWSPSADAATEAEALAPELYENKSRENARKAPEYSFSLPFEEALELFDEAIVVQIFESERWISRSVRARMIASGPLSGSAWPQSDQHCLEVLAESAVVHVSVFQGEPVRGATSCAILAHDFGDAKDGTTVPATLLRRGMIQGPGPITDMNKFSSSAEVTLARGRYVIIVLDDRVGKDVEYALRVHCKRVPDLASAETIAFWAHSDVDWQDVESARDDALASGATDKMSAAQVQEVCTLREEHASLQATPNCALDALLVHLNALAAHFAVEHARIAIAGADDDPEDIVRA